MSKSANWTAKFILAAIVIVNLVRSTTGSCIQGFFEFSGSCFPCDNSCSTCENSSQCTSCSDNMYLNSTTQLCQTCSQGQYFDATVNICRTCDGSCLKGCSYQSNCFICQNGQYYDLESKSCVTTCGINTVIVNSSQYHSIPICKSANIYVDPSSSSIIELGTQNDPYKNLVLAFIDVLNIFAHRNISINIYIKENKILPVTIGSMFIINIPQVSITTYTDSGTNPRQSAIVYSDSSVVLLSKSTLFNIVSSTAINISSALNNSILLTAEKNSLQTKNIGLMINRCNLSIKNVYIATNFTLSSTSFTFMRAVYQQSKSITISNASFKVKGNLFDTYDPLNFNATNIDIDYVDTPRGFYFQISCNYTGASTQNEIYLNNLTVYNSQARTVDMVGSLISFSGAANFTMLNSNIAIYGSISNPYPPIQFISNSGCNLNDGITQNFRITGSQFTLNQDSEYSKYIQIYSNLDSSYLRPVTILIDSLVFNGIVMSSQPLIKMYVNGQTQIMSNNMTISGATFQDDAMYFSAADYVSLTAYTFKNITQLGNQIVHFDSVNMVDMSNIVIDGCNLASNDQLYYFFHRSNSGYFNITGLTARNMNINSRYIIYTTGVPSFVITNSIFESISISSYDSLMKTGTISELFIDSVNFTQIKSNTPGDNTNYLFDYDSFDLSKTTNFNINNIVITKSELAIFNIKKINGVPQYSKYLNISNLEYSNSTFTDSNDIMTFTGMEQSIDFTISLTNIKFSSISFSTSGNLLLFQQQLSNPIVISGILLSNLTNAYILIKADDPHSLLLPTSIQASGMTISNVNAGYKSFINVMENSLLSISNSNIDNVFSFDNGSVLRCSAKNSQVFFANSVFKHNSAIQGGVFQVENDGIVNLTNCTLIYNFAIQAGIVQAQNNGAFSFHNSTISSNYALSFPVGQCFDSILTSVFDNTTISSNTYYDKYSILEFITNSTNCGTLCWVNTLFSNFLIMNSNLMDIPTSFYTIQLISSSLEISGMSTISNQMYIIDAFLSTIAIKNSTIRDTLLSGTGINVSASNLTISNMMMNNVSTISLTYPFIQVALGSDLLMDSVNYINSGAPLLTLIGSSCTISNLNSSNLDIYSHFVILQQATNATFYNWNLLNISIVFACANMFTDSYISSMVNLNFNAVNWIPFWTKNSQINLIDSMIIRNSMLTAFFFVKSNITMMSNTTIDTCGTSYLFYGTLYSENSNISISNCLFNNDTGSYGGAIQLLCDTTTLCVTNIQNTTFSNNYASIQGGAIYYDPYRPNMSNIIFLNNSAPSGPDISSYPVKVVLTETNSTFINLTNVASGQTQDINLRFSVVDYDNQLSSTTSGGRITISPLDKNTSVLGLTSASIVNGSATFTSLILVANPGLTNVPFKISSNAIDSSKLLKQFGTSSIQDPMVVSFRFCKPGEYFDSQQCKVCDPGTFSLDWNSTVCYTCPSNANCLGGVQIYVNSGYWRSSTNSTYMSECPRQNSCLGQYHPENQYPVACDSGYSGILCTDCTVVDGEQYERQSNFECAKCPILVYNILRIMGLILLVSIFFIILIIVNIRKKKESQQSILMRILANYLQLLSVSMSFNMKFPPILVQIFYPLQKIGASSEAFLSLDCFFRDASIKGFTPSTAMFKVFLTGMLPLFLIIVAAIVWVLLYATFKKWFKDLKRNLIVTIIVIIYLLHPTITKVSFEIFQCIRVDESEYRAKLDLSIKCFSFEHMKWGLILGFPMIIIWIIGCPVSVAIILFKNRKNLSEARIQRYLLILYQGLQEKCFYWELVNTGRKISMVAINVFLSTMPLLYSSTTAVILLVILIRVQIKLKPYKDELNNELEIESMITGTATLFCGVLFTSDDNKHAIIVLAVLVVLILINIKFLLNWCFCISFTLMEKYKLFHAIFIILGIILFKRNLAEKMINNAGKFAE